MRAASMMPLFLFPALVACGTSPDESPNVPGARGTGPTSGDGVTRPGNGTTFDAGLATADARSCVVGDAHACVVAGAKGACAQGTQQCVRAPQGEDGLYVFGWSACVGPTPRQEICNGDDDDCNGTVDDGLVCSPPSDAGPPPPPPVDAGPPPPPSDPPCSERCDGAVSYVDQTAKYGLWVKVVRCKSPGRYDLYLGPTASGPFAKIGDDNLSGQDHCELVNPAFTMVDDATMSVGTVEYGGAVYAYPAAYGTALYHRAYLGQPFKYAADATTEKNSLTSCWYECGVSF